MTSVLKAVSYGLALEDETGIPNLGLITHVPTVVIPEGVDISRPFRLAGIR